jgi:type I restriction enzyme S subunit
MTARALTVAPSAECRGLAPCASYRDSGLPWLGAIPSHWDVRRGKYLFREIDNRTDTGTETLLSLRQAHGLIPHAKVSNKPVTPDELKGYKRIRSGQMVLNRMQASNGMFAVAREDGLVSPDYAVFQPIQPMEPDYFINLFKTNIYRAKFRQESKGLGTGMSGFLRLYSDRFGAIHVPQPPQNEQRQIVEFVSSYDRRVRRLIRNKRRLIGLLNEQKQAIINRAVMRGLNPDAPMKPTGIDWMPEVPAHWNIAALRHRYHVDLGKMLDEKRISGDHLVRYLRNTDVQWDRINTSDLPEMDILKAEYSRYTLLPGDLLVCEGGEVGRTAIWQGAEEVTGYQKALHRLRPIDRTREVPRWLFYLMLEFAKRGVFAADGNENTIAHLTNEKLRAFRFPFPQAKEQQDIVSFLDQETSEIERIKSRVESEITLILEYRERLIADVVTGKLDVRDIEGAALADEPIADEDDALHEDLEAADTDELAEAED